MTTGDKTKECFVVMPISDSDGYETGHFQHVYNDIIMPACEMSGFKPVRADEVKQTNLIHLDILQKLIDSPMCICDLSSRNPNVLFELALRQAFDKPVALIQEVGTKPIFDISPLRYTEYRKERIYHEVLEDQKKIAESAKETFDAYEKGKGINSIVKLLSLAQPAKLVETGEMDRQSDIQALILSEMEQMRGEFRSAMRSLQENRLEGPMAIRFSRKYAELLNNADQLEAMLRHVEISPDMMPNFDMRLEVSKHLLRELLSSTQRTDKEMNILMDIDRRIDRAEYEFRQLLERQASPKSRRTK